MERMTFMVGFGGSCVEGRRDVGRMAVCESKTGGLHSGRDKNLTPRNYDTGRRELMCYT